MEPVRVNMEDKAIRLEKQMKKLRQIREMAGMNRTQFSLYMGIPHRTLEDWEAGRREAPDYVLRLIAYQIRMEKCMKEQGLEYREGQGIRNKEEMDE